MKKWEYQTLLGTADSPYLNMLGDKGWEVYSVVSHNSDSISGHNTADHICTYFLKRELIDTKQVIL